MMNQDFCKVCPERGLARLHRWTRPRCCVSPLPGLGVWLDAPFPGLTPGANQMPP